MLIVLTTFSNNENAESLAQKIIEARLAACVQILPPMKSIYVWNDEIQKESEVLMLIKTLDENYESLESFIRENHLYENPEIVAVSAEKVSTDYLKWMQKSLK